MGCTDDDDTELVAEPGAPLHVNDGARLERSAFHARADA
jgi:hypothetical protein